MMLVGGCSQDRAAAVREMEKGINTFKRGQSVKAIEYLESASDLDPTYAKPPLYLGQIYHRKLDELDNAERAYREALSRDPDDPEIPYKLGAVLADAQKPDEAQTQFERAVDQDPQYAKAWFRLGLAQLAQDKYSPAVDSFMTSIRADARMKMDDKDAGGAAYDALGGLYLDFGLFDRALQVYENAILNNVGSAQLHAGKGIAQLKLGRYDDAAKSLKKTLEIDPTHVSAAFNLAVAQNELGHRDEAIAVLKQYLSRSHDQARGAAARGLLQKLRTSNDGAQP